LLPLLLSCCISDVPFEIFKVFFMHYTCAGGCRTLRKT
jgi:hypothetical protein